jgi:SAM-dependent methyltransferase
MTREQRDRRLFDSIAAQYARKDKIPSSALARKAVLHTALAPLLKDSTNLGAIVDVGCGVGGPARYLFAHYDRYIGIDQSSEMIEAARIFNRGNDRAEFLAENVKSSSLPDGVADLVLSDGALHHMTDLDDVMTALRRLGRPGGHLVAREPQNGNPLIQFLRKTRSKVDDGYSPEQIYFAPKALEALFVRHGLDVISVSCQGFLAPPFAQVVLNPQTLSAPACRIAVRIDEWLHRHLPTAWRRFSFNVTVIGRFPEQVAS